MPEEIKPQLAEKQDTSDGGRLNDSEAMTPPRWRENRWKILGGILGVLVLAGAVFGAYKVGQKQVQPGPQPTLTPVAVATPTPDQTTDWKTYRNEQHGFEIKYPNDYFIKEEIGGAGYGFLSMFSIAPVAFGMDNTPFTLAIFANEKRLDLKSYYGELERNNLSGDPISPFGQDEPVIKRLESGELVYYFDKVYCVATCRKAVWANKDKVYEFTDHTNGLGLNYQQQVEDFIFDLILSTFKFLPSTSPSATSSGPSGSGPGE